MDEHIGERVCTLETDVAVIHSNYVRRDEFADLRTEVRVGFAQVDARIETGIAKLDAQIDKSTATLLKWLFASQLSVAALVLAAIKYL
ncbi:hypothetical protein GTP44_19850 [Duganella sp. FT50W]|uniref:DUF1640 domain-containing protein n=1 Tax=Duganella lactea TaxID=2692173 RepID=A0A6L8MN61_9BURK|nr:hypothetical protein [Duganella lactea]MYM84194.1 hypothetical protein [Duganella lactea]